jgi:chromosomal replication initiator protein
MNSAADIWSKVLSLMKEDLTTTAIHTWFDDSVAVELTSSSFIIYTPTSFKQKIISTRYLDYIKKALKELFAADMGVTVLCEDELAERQEQAEENKENRNILIGSNDYTFDSFVVGSSNRFAYNAAMAVAMKPASIYNPLLIYGQSGLGKTHLLYAIANQAQANFRGFRILYVKGETFTNEMIQALRQGAMEQFRAKYRECDLLLMDDVQFIAGKESTQEEFFHTFNTLYEAKKQIVLTSDRPPNEMVRLEDRLRTRFEQGLIADIQPPDYETRMAIVQKKGGEHGPSSARFRCGVYCGEYHLQCASAGGYRSENSRLSGAFELRFGHRHSDSCHS